MKVYYIQEDTNVSINIKDKLIEEGAIEYLGNQFLDNLIALVSTGKEKNSFDIIHIYCDKEFERIKNLHGKDRIYLISEKLCNLSKFKQDIHVKYSWKEVRQLLEKLNSYVEDYGYLSDTDLEQYFQDNLK